MSRDRYSRSNNNIVIVIDQTKPVREIDIVRAARRYNTKCNINIIEVASESDIDDIIVITY